MTSPPAPRSRRRRLAGDLRAPWRLLRGHHDLRLLLGAGLVSMTGDWLLGVGLTYSVYAATGSTLASAVTLLASFVPQVLVGLVAGVLVDRWDRSRTMVVTNLLLALGLLPLLAVASGGIWIVYAVLVWESVVEVFFAPAEQALLPRLVADEDLVTANALNGQTQQLSRLAGSALGGVTAAVGGIPAVALVDVATFVVATVLLLRIRASGRAASRPVLTGEPEPRGPGRRAGRAERTVRVVGARLAGLRQEWRDGLQAAWESRTVRALLTFTVITWTGEGVMGALFAPFVRDVLHSGSGILGLATGVQAVGGVVGGFAAAAAGRHWPAVRMLAVGAVLFGLVDLAIFLYPLALGSPWPAVAGMVAVGVPGAVMSAGVVTLYQRHTDDSSRGRVMSLVYATRSLAAVVGATAAGLLGDAVGIVPVLALQGVGYVAAGVLVGLRLDPGRGVTSSPHRARVAGGGDPSA